MATTPICKIEGCGKTHEAHGWCRGHYGRWRKHGDPLAGRTPNGEPERFFREVVMAYDGDECLPWPFGRSGNGYGKLGDENVHRLVCIEANGAPPTPEHDAAHSCGKGHEACVTKLHLGWELHRDNMKNVPIKRNNTSGHVGVSWHKAFGKWHARISDNGRCHSLGYFDEIDAAITARKAAEPLYGYHPNHGRSRQP